MLQLIGGLTLVYILFATGIAQLILLGAANILLLGALI
jgi:hypothetical protein